jgi:signal transduction histidine kinase/ActR/RegA family two-component response regulator
MADAVGTRSQELYLEHRRRLDVVTSNTFSALLLAVWLLSIAIAIWVSPWTWRGADSSMHPHLLAAICLGGIVAVPSAAIAYLRPAARNTRHVVAVAQMLLGALLIHLTGGRIESHFYVFGALAFLSFYRDWRVLLTASAVVVVDHVLRGILIPFSVYGVVSSTFWRAFEHAGWVVFEDVFLIVACVRGTREMKEIADRHAHLEQHHAHTLELEDRLRHGQKMEAIGQLAGGVAHDFNNILAVILADAEFALECLPESHEAREAVQGIEQATQRAAALTGQLLTLSRPNALERKVVAVDAAIVDIEKMLSRLIGADIRISTDLQARSGSIEIDPSHLEQVLLNLAVNARDAMPRGGNLTIVTRNIDLDDSGAAQIGLTAGRFVRLSVTDDGCGMDAATQARIFEPFFTTKEVGRGTGLGLSTVFGIVQHGRGAITIASDIDRGTTFEIFFPRVSAIAAALVAAARPLTVRGSETILVVEDNEQLRIALRRMLASRGYRVLEADCASAALEIIGRRNERVDLVLTDLVMPGMDGRTMAGQMLRRHPGTCIVYMSGYADHPSMKGAPIGPDDHFLGKPFTAEELAIAVRRALRSATMHANVA